ncbi:MAG: hypothetical protein AAGN35_00240 [Bacteroidota bacterium]
MKKISIPILALLLLGVGSLWAQDSKVTTGVVAYQGGDFEKAIKAFDEGLKDPSLLKEKNLPKAHYYRAMTNLKLMAMQKVQPEQVMFSIYDDLKKAKAADIAGKWEKKIMAEMPNVAFGMLRAGVAAFEKASDRGVTEEESTKGYRETIKYMDAYGEVSPIDFTADDLRAQSYLALNDSAKALAGFKAAAAKYQANSPRNPDQLIAYVYYRLALLERFMNNDIDAALGYLKAGKVALDKEHERFQKKGDAIPPEKMNAIRMQYSQAGDYITKFRLDLLLNAPDKLKEALDEFEQAIQKEPKNYLLHVAYAQLLEKTDETKAEQIYEQATTIDPKKEIAWFNLGALYVNKGVALYKESNNITDDLEKAKAMQEEGDANYRKAFPYLQKAHEIEPCDGATLQALMNICINLSATDESMMGEYKNYKQKKADCGL